MSDIMDAEVAAAIRHLKNNKAPGLDQISAEMLKAGGDEVVRVLTTLLNDCWHMERVPNDWRQGVIVKLPKKGNLADCNNWRGITLLSVPGKVFCLVLLKRILRAVDQALRDEQAGFRSGRSCTEQIFALRNIIEQSSEYQKPLLVNFIDFKKAFDSVHRKSLWNIARLYGIPQRFIAIFQNLYQDSSCCIRTDTGHTAFFTIETGVRQGCILSPFFFLMMMDFVMRRALTQPASGIPWTGQGRLTDLEFADDIVLLAQNGKVLQEMTTSLEHEAAKVGLRISTDKTNVMAVGRMTPVRITVSNQLIEEVKQFTYLGSIVAADGGTNADVNRRIGRAFAVFQQLQLIWARRTIHTNNKLRLFNSIIIPTAIYASETWTSSRAVIHKLNVFQQRCLRRILSVSYHDRISNEEILRRTNSRSLAEMVVERRMRFAGHILRMSDHRHAKIALRWTPPRGKRKVVRPHNTWRRTFMEDLRTLDVKWEDVEIDAADRARWDFAFVASDKDTCMLKCHVFRCNAPAKTIASALHEMCSKIIAEKAAMPPSVPRSLTMESISPEDLPHQVNFLDAVRQRVQKFEVEYIGNLPVSRAMGLECPDRAQREQERALSSNTVKKTYLSWFPGGGGSSVIADGVCKR
ncbi:probable RNA-directed DNA polymerase from transposon BS isoform X2 [Ictalurus furcatus]|uniref:probable RNA-directed DNA polymerase from transposon BS isoform X2 n=1 Tax=Ictalurus furcatus TaxID=66913 RepID=UPI0023509535|nr:probable RNA-directed DNA polymerase from transposon BS isoform X2 [Ictalurus furcatus]